MVKCWDCSIFQRLGWESGDFDCPGRRGNIESGLAGIGLHDSSSRTLQVYRILGLIRKSHLKIEIISSLHSCALIKVTCIAELVRVTTACTLF